MRFLVAWLEAITANSLRAPILKKTITKKGQVEWLRQKP
jgi:hypothetical protein